MATTLDFFSDARKRMVDSQLRPNRVNDPRILDAMRTLPRERFLPDALRPLAYADQNVSLGGGRVLAQPMILARLMQAGEPLGGETVLVAGSGTGYAAAVFAALGLRVTALEEPGPLAEHARATLADIAPSVTVVVGPLPVLWPAGAPYDLIFLDGAVPEIPAVALGQLSPASGRLMTIVATGPRTANAVRAEPTGIGLSSRALFDCLCPILPGFAPAPAFAF